MFKENAKEFAESSQIKIEQILSPLKQKMDIFQANLQEVSKAGTAERLTLKCKIDMMADCSKVLAEETHRLTRTLKGDVKKQGTWGELILQKVLEASGLRENVEYTLQGTGLGLSSEEGRRMQPDVIINLPDSKRVIIDSKMSYMHYDDYLNRTSDEDKAESLKKLTLSLKEHVKELSEKNYHCAKNLENPNFVLLFVPIEAIFSLVIEKEPSLFEEAWKKSIIIVSPTNILAILRTIESIWKTERQNKNTQKIAEDAAALYDKFVDFLKDLESTQKYMQNAGESFDKAMLKLSSGRGNLIKKTEDLRKLGLKTKKQIPADYLEDEELITLD
jgi:DNA recombination protein RmuC